jgi:class 3 adenylate cyclase
VGKTYMSAGGLKFIESGLDPNVRQKHFVVRTLDLAVDMMAFIEKFTYRAGKHLKIKIGINYGNCIFGVIGYHKPQFSLIGDTINTTSRVCTTGKSGTITLSNSAYQVFKTNEKTAKNTDGKVEKQRFVVSSADSEIHRLHEGERRCQRLHVPRQKDEIRAGQVQEESNHCSQ